MKKTKRLFLAAMLLLAAALLGGCGAERRATLRVGVKNDVANFGLYDTDSGRYSGMEIDLAQMLCDELGYGQISFTSANTSTRELLVESNVVDMVIATFSATDERRERFDFSSPYYIDHTAVMVEESSLIGGIEDLPGLRVGVVSNSSNARSLADYLAEKGLGDPVATDAFSIADYETVDFVQYRSYQAISDALERGEVDAFVADHSVLTGYAGEGRTLLADEFSSEEFGVCTKKGSSLSARVNEAIERWASDGTLDSLKVKWGI